MNFRKFLKEFALTFVIVFVVAVVVTLAWNLVFHGRSAADWETAFRLAIILGIVIPWTKPRPQVEKTA